MALHAWLEGPLGRALHPNPWDRMLMSFGWEETVKVMEEEEVKDEEERRRRGGGG